MRDVDADQQCARSNRTRPCGASHLAGTSVCDHGTAGVWAPTTSHHGARPCVPARRCANSLTITGCLPSWHQIGRSMIPRCRSREAAVAIAWVCLPDQNESRQAHQRQQQSCPYRARRGSHCGPHPQTILLPMPAVPTIGSPVRTRSRVACRSSESFSVCSVHADTPSGLVHRASLEPPMPALRPPTPTYWPSLCPHPLVPAAPPDARQLWIDTLAARASVQVTV